MSIDEIAYFVAKTVENDWNCPLMCVSYDYSLDLLICVQ